MFDLLLGEGVAKVSNGVLFDWFPCLIYKRFPACSFFIVLDSVYVLGDSEKIVDFKFVRSKGVNYE